VLVVVAVPDSVASVGELVAVEVVAAVAAVVAEGGMSLGTLAPAAVTHGGTQAAAVVAIAVYRVRVEGW
jgi:hypothetical protein